MSRCSAGGSFLEQGSTDQTSVFDMTLNFYAGKRLGLVEIGTFQLGCDTT